MVLWGSAENGDQRVDAESTGPPLPCKEVGPPLGRGAHSHLTQVLFCKV